jgi:hypothetical protein
MPRDKNGVDQIGFLPPDFATVRMRRHRLSICGHRLADAAAKTVAVA